MKSAAEIYYYLSQKLDTSDEDVQELLKTINDIAVSERTYGNDPRNALRKIKSFTEHGGRVFAVDRSAPTMICPACGKEQNANRAVCISCAALFRQRSFPPSRPTAPRTAFPCPAPRFYHPRRELCLTLPTKLAIIIFAGDGEE